MDNGLFSSVQIWSEKTYFQCFATNYFLVVGLFISCFVKVLIAYEIGRSIPISPRDRSAPNVKSDESVVRMNGVSKFGY